MINQFAKLLKAFLVMELLFMYNIHIRSMESQEKSNDGQQNYSAGLYCYNINQMDKALSQFASASQKGYREANFYLGIIYLRNGDIKAAKRYFKLTNTNDAKALCYLGNIYEYEGKIDKAKTCFFKAVHYKHPEACNKLGVIFFQENDFKVAEQYYKLGINFGSLNAQCNLAGLYYFLGDLEKARDAYQVASDSGEAKVQYHLGRIYLALGKIIEAEKCFLFVLYKENHSSALFQLGNINCINDNLEMAKYFYSQAAARGHKEAESNLKIIILQESKKN